jgi:hypothetical protein
MNNIIKDYGIFVLIYILFISIITLKFKYYKQSIMITILLVCYLYYKNYYSSLYELFNNSKNVFTNNISNNNMKTSYNQYSSINELNNTDLSSNIELESSVITDIPSLAKLNTIKTTIFNFIDKYIPEESRPTLQVKQENNKKKNKQTITNLINKYFIVISKLIKSNNEELNYFQKLKTIEKEILTIIHNSIFLNHNADKEADKLISKITIIFTNIQNDLTKIANKEIRHKNDYIPTINDFKPLNSYEDNILF